MNKVLVVKSVGMKGGAFLRKNARHYPFEVNDVVDLLSGVRMRGLTIIEAAKELNVSTRTVIRMMHDGRLKAEKVEMPSGKFFWIIDPMSAARIQVRKEMKQEQRKVKKEVK